MKEFKSSSVPSKSLSEDIISTRDSDVAAYEKGRNSDGTTIRRSREQLPQSLDTNDSISKDRKREYKAAQKSKITEEEKKKFNSYAIDEDNLSKDWDGLHEKNSPLWTFLSIVGSSIGTAAMTLTAFLIIPAEGGWSVHISPLMMAVLLIAIVVTSILIYILGARGTKINTSPVIRVIGTTFLTTIVYGFLFTAAMIIGHFT